MGDLLRVGAESRVTAKVKPAGVRFYFDADVLGVAKVIDKVWIPEIAARQWLIITRDSRIRKHRAEVEAVTRHGARMVTLSGHEAVNRWDQLEVLMCQWRRIEALADRPGPFIERATRSGLSSVRLP